MSVNPKPTEAPGAAACFGTFSCNGMWGEKQVLAVRDRPVAFANAESGPSQCEPSLVAKGAGERVRSYPQPDCSPDVAAGTADDSAAGNGRTRVVPAVYCAIANGPSRRY